MKEAKITCPHCGKPIRVRQINMPDTEKLWAAFDKAFEEMDEFFRKYFRPMFRR